MSLRFMESCDHYVTADLAKKWTSSVGMSIISSQGRRSTAALTQTNWGNFVSLTLDNQGTWILGFAFRYTALPASARSIIARWMDGATNQVELGLTPSGTLTVYRGGTTLLGTSTAAIATATYAYLEWLVVFHASAGQVMLRVNGTEVLALTGIQTSASGNAWANAVRIGSMSDSTGNMGVTYWDDLYLCDGAGSTPHNTFLGDCRVDTLLPNADGTSQQWAPSTPGTHYTLVDEAAPNTTDYVSSATAGQRDTYGMQDLSAVIGTIYGVQLNLAALKSDAGARSIKPLLLSGGSEALGASTALSTSQLYTRAVQVTDPATGAAWIEAGVNAVQAGAEVV